VGAGLFSLSAGFEIVGEPALTAIDFERTFPGLDLIISFMVVSGGFNRRGRSWRPGRDERDG
jgi:hypothetical protein